MRRTLLLLLLAATASLAQEDRQAVTFRLKKDPQAPMRGWMLEFNDNDFLFARFGEGKKVTIRWDELVHDDASRLRLKLELEMTEDEKLGIIDGNELFFRGGGSVKGLLERLDEEKQVYWFRSDGLVLPYPADRVQYVEEIRVSEADIYSEEEVYVRRLQRRPPRNAREHRALAAYMYDIGNWAKSNEHYQAAIGADPALQAELEARLREIKELLDDEQAGAIFREAKSLANLQGDYDAATLMIQMYIAQHPGAKRRGIRVLEEIEQRKHDKLVIAFHRAVHQSTESLVRRFLIRQQPDIQTAMSWATSGLKEEIAMRVRRRLNLDEEQYERFLATRWKAAPHFASYSSGSFVISKRAKKGTSSKNAVRGDPDRWWSGYIDTGGKATWLTAFAVERLPELFEVVQVRVSDCERCGGTGIIKKASLKGLKALGGGHEWVETCPRCFGARQDRAVAYR